MGGSLSSEPDSRGIRYGIGPLRRNKIGFKFCVLSRCDPATALIADYHRRKCLYRDFVRREGAPLHVTRANPTGLLPSSSSSGHNQTRDLTKKLSLVWTFSFPDFRSSAQSGKNTNACPFNRRNRAIAPRHSPLAKSKATTSSLATQ